ncbi:hypothetical protein FRC12_025229 [Ceratobasidium sp. 428]|nr:hypothetical protein FRC12_025229 [Ceratobasidium sp. 428]
MLPKPKTRRAPKVQEVAGVPNPNLPTPAPPALDVPAPTEPKVDEEDAEQSNHATELPTRWHPGHGKGIRNCSIEEIFYLLDVIDTICPSGTMGLEDVAEAFNNDQESKYPAYMVESLQQKINVLMREVNGVPPTGLLHMEECCRCSLEVHENIKQSEPMGMLCNRRPLDVAIEGLSNQAEQGNLDKDDNGSGGSKEWNAEGEEGGDEDEP